MKLDQVEMSSLQNNFGKSLELILSVLCMFSKQQLMVVSCMALFLRKCFNVIFTYFWVLNIENECRRYQKNYKLSFNFYIHVEDWMLFEINNRKTPMTNNTPQKNCSRRRLHIPVPHFSDNQACFDVRSPFDFVVIDGNLILYFWDWKINGYGCSLATQESETNPAARRRRYFKLS